MDKLLLRNSQTLSLIALLTFLAMIALNPVIMQKFGMVKNWVDWNTNFREWLILLVGIQIGFLIVFSMQFREPGAAFRWIAMISLAVTFSGFVFMSLAVPNSI